MCPWCWLLHLGMDCDLPVPSALVGLSYEDQLQPKRARKDKLPECFVAVVKQGKTYSAVGLINVVAVNAYTDSDATTWQYLNLVAIGNAVDKSKCVVWKIADARPIIDGPLILDSPDFMRHCNIVGKALTSAVIGTLARKSIRMDGNPLPLGTFMGKQKLRTFIVPESIWQELAYAVLKCFVTSSSVLYHAGIAADTVGPPPEVLTQAAGIPGASNRSNVNGSGSDTDSDSDGELVVDKGGGSGGIVYAFAVMKHAMQLGMLLKNACNIKQAMRSSLEIARGSSEAR